MCSSEEVERLNALTEAAAEGKTNDVIKLLEGGNISINGKDTNHQTALYRACNLGKSQTVRELLKRGADCNIDGQDQKTPLYIAVSQCHPAIVELLLQYGAHIDDFGPDEVTALHLAVRQKNFALLVILLRYGANPLFTARYDAYKFSFGQTKVEHEFRTPLATCKAMTWERGIGLLEEAEEAWAWAGKNGVIAMMAQKAKEKYGTTAVIPDTSPRRNHGDYDCSICTLNSTTKVALICGHVMCDQCAIRSIETQQKCPFCQRSAQTCDIRRIY